ncbi:uncharacterized protein VTP21DRAFT_6457 [Calcarisporiella thermophila]|uniref:uncharacterized protein n=1 Tax=Calcarisporiella thermophila TaxID=911321 RepID=UPI003743219E
MTVSVPLDSTFESISEHIKKVRNAIKKCRRCVAITGAGVSVSAGIPDFRSTDGLFALLKEKYPKSVVSGKDLFDATLFLNPTTTRIFYHFIAEFKERILQAQDTAAHRFLKSLDAQGKLLRCYSQNIDSLEKRVGLETRIDPSNKAATRAVLLHGDLDHVVCTVCHNRYIFDEEVRRAFRAGDPPDCPSCMEQQQVRDIMGMRSRPSGFLRPDIVLYNEQHPHGSLIGELSEFDLRKNPDLLIIMGTSLKVPGIKRLVKEMAKCVHARGGTVIFVNRVALARSEWDGVFDYHFIGDADQAIELLSGENEASEDELTQLETKHVKRPAEDDPAETERKKGRIELLNNMVVVQTKLNFRATKSSTLANNEKKGRTGKVGRPRKVDTKGVTKKVKDPTTKPSRSRSKTASKSKQANSNGLDKLSDTSPNNTTTKATSAPRGRRKTEELGADQTRLTLWHKH